MVTNSLLPRLHAKASSTNSSAAQAPEATERNTKAHPRQQFIPGDGIDPQVLKAYIAHHYGSIDWRPAVNTTDGREGFLLKTSAPIKLETVQFLQQETVKLREAEKQQKHSMYFDKLHTSWALHQQYLEHEAQIQDINSVSTQRIDRNLPVPFLDLPPKYDDIEGLHSRRLSTPPALVTSKSPGLKRRPVSCSDLEFFGPSGGFYPDGYSGSGAEPAGEDANGLTFSRVYGPPSLPEIMPMTGSDRGAPLSTAPQNVDSPHQGHSSANLKPTHMQNRSKPMTRARSATSLHSSHYGLAYQPSQRLNVPSSELFLGTPETPLYGSGLQLQLHGQNYADGRPAWA